ncbi:MAG: FG-GAP repeat domain-containing protein [Planctomycetota bacterium]
MTLQLFELTNRPSRRLPPPPCLYLFTTLFTLILLATSGCTRTSNAPTTSPFLFTQLAPSTKEVIQQLNGSDPPQWIVDVKSTGMALLDMTGKGDWALLLTCGSNLERWKQNEPGFSPLLYRIDDQLNLDPIANSAGIPALKWTSGCAATDLDGDGDDDLLLTGIEGSLLLRNDNGNFVPVHDSGISTNSWCTSAAFGDLDLDGDLDLFICRYLDFPFDSPPENGDEWSCLWENQAVLCGPRGLPASQDLVFENLGDWKFVDRTRDWGFENSTPGYGLAVTIIDLYGDPHPEIFVANDSCPNHLWSRQPDGTWLEDGLLSGLGVDQDGQEQAGMGIAVAGLDSSGGLDLAVTNFERESVNLYQNQGDGTFQDTASRTGLSALTRSTLGWGVGIADFDLNGTPDLFICNGHVYPQADLAEVSPGYLQMDQLLMGRRSKEGNLFFMERNQQIENQTSHVGRCLILADLDRDGDVDAISSSLNGSPHVYRNNSNPNKGNGIDSATVQLRQQETNLHAIGSTIRILDTANSVEYPVLRNSSFQSTGFSTVTLPLDGENEVHRIEVKWTDGGREKFLINKGYQVLDKGRGKKP